MNVKVKFVVHYMVVDRPREGIMDVKAILRVIGPECTLNISTSSDGDKHGPVQVELVIENIIIVPHGRDASERKDNVLG